jgi:hypothetical protein
LGKRSTALLVTTLTLALSFAVSTSAFAKGGHGGGGGAGGGSSVSLVLVDPSSDGMAHSGQQVTFAVATTATTSPFVSLNCYKDGVWVYTASAGFFAAYPWSQNFTLSSSSWTSGDAECTARLYSSRDGTRTTTLATTSFHVNP